MLEKSLARQTDLQRAGMMKGQLHSKQHEVRAERACSCLLICWPECKTQSCNLYTSAGSIRHLLWLL